jgi:hypothetical protein
MPAESRRAPSLAPLVAAPATPAPNAVPEPSFELVRPRKRRGALWLLLGAGVAIGAFAARPWLARQVAAATGALPDNASAPIETAPSAPLAPTASNGALAPAESGNAPRLVVGIASTPAMPSARTPRARAGAREEHVVIHDSLEPQVSEPARPTPAPTPEPTAAPAPAAPPSPSPAAPSPSPAAKPKSVPVSDADRYGI